MRKTHRPFAGVAAAGLALALALAGCASDTNTGADGDSKAAGGSISEQYDLAGQTFVVGSKEFTENKILGQITIAAIQAAGGTAEDKTGISGTATVRAALTSGEIDMYWDYTGTGWVNILGNTTTDLPDDLFKAVKDADAANKVVWIGPSPLNNSYGLAVKKDLADQEGLKTMSDLAEYIKANPSDAKICAASEFIQRDDGLQGVEKAYGVKFSVVELDMNLIYPQVGKQCVVGEITTTDARIQSNDLFSLEDDKKFFVPYNAALTVRSDVAEANPDLDKLFTEIAEALDNETMIVLNGKVDVDGEREADVAKDWLREKGFIE